MSILLVNAAGEILSNMSSLPLKRLFGEVFKQSNGTGPEPWPFVLPEIIVYM